MADQLQQHDTVWRKGEVATFFYDRTRRYDVHKGAQVANVRLSARADNVDRQVITEEAIREAVRVYTERWGSVEWWIARINIWHSTLSVIVELIVEPV